VVVLNISPEYIVHLLYGRQYEGVDALVPWLCAPAAVYGVSTVLVIWAAAIEWTRAIFISSAVATVFTMVAAYPLTLYGGVVGVVLGSLLVETIRVAVLAVPLVGWCKATKSEEQKIGVRAQQAADASGNVP
jgi:O-antigen/teichoic acid export membrane protein